MTFNAEDYDDMMGGKGRSGDAAGKKKSGAKAVEEDDDQMIEDY